MILGFRDDCIIDGTVRLVCLEMFEIDGIIQLGGKIRRTGNKKSLLAIELHSVDLFSWAMKSLTILPVSGEYNII